MPRNGLKRQPFSTSCDEYESVEVWPDERKMREALRTYDMREVKAKMKSHDADKEKEAELREALRGVGWPSVC